MTAAFVVYILFMTATYQCADEPRINAPMEHKTVNEQLILAR